MNISQSKPQFDEVLEHFKQELKQVRTGRATPAIVDHVVVDAYGSRTPLRELASISVSDARTIVIQPWDASIVKAVEKGVQEARIGANAVVDGNILRISMPQLTEESRKELAKGVSERLEDAKQALRHVRDAVRESLLGAEKEKKITEDDRYRGQKDLDTMTAEYQTKLVSLAEEKVKEIMTI